MGCLMNDASSVEGTKNSSISAMVRVLANSLINCGLLTVINNRLNSTLQSHDRMSFKHSF